MDFDAQSSDTQPGASATLADATSSGPIDHKQAVELVISLCEKTAPAHQRGLAYGGLSPRKVLIDENLSLSITLEPASGSLETIDESNRDYVAPELLSGKDCNARCDVYSLGRILYRLLTGTDPQGDTPPRSFLHPQDSPGPGHPDQEGHHPRSRSTHRLSGKAGQ